MSKRGAQPAAAEEPPGKLRLDRWLWHIRAFKTRHLAADRIEGGGVRVNGQPCRKPGRAVAPGDVVTLAIPGQPPRVRILEVIAPGIRRGPAAEAATLYRDLSPDPAPSADEALE